MNKGRRIVKINAMSQAKKRAHAMCQLFAGKQAS